MMERQAVLDASAMVDLLLRGPLARAIDARISGWSLYAPAHFDAEILSAIGHLHRAGALSPARAGRLVDIAAAAPVVRHPLPELLVGAWRRRERLRLVDALYVELAERLGVVIVTTDAALARTHEAAELVTT